MNFENFEKKIENQNFQNHFSPRKKYFIAPIFFLMINLYKYFTHVDFCDSCRKMATFAGGSVSDTLFCIDNLRKFWFFRDFFDILNIQNRFFGKSKFSKSFFSKIFFESDFFWWKIHIKTPLILIFMVIRAKRPVSGTKNRQTSRDLAVSYFLEEWSS